MSSSLRRRASSRFGELIACGFLWLGSIVWAHAQAAPASVWDGVYSVVQAERGAATYLVYCRECHAADLSGGSHDGDPAPALRVKNFAVSRKNLGNLYSYVLKSMPRDDPGSLTQTMAADVVAFLLRENGYPSGSADLPGNPDRLALITIESRASQ